MHKKKKYRANRDQPVSNADDDSSLTTHLQPASQSQQQSAKTSSRSDQRLQAWLESTNRPG